MHVPIMNTTLQILEWMCPAPAIGETICAILCLRAAVRFRRDVLSLVLWFLAVAKRVAMRRGSRFILTGDRRLVACEMHF
jgi:hypothetical protein